MNYVAERREHWRTDRTKWQEDIAVAFDLGLPAICNLEWLFEHIECRQGDQACS